MIFFFNTNSNLTMLMIMIIITLTSFVFADDDPEILGEDTYNFDSSCYSIQHCQSKNGTSFYSNQCGSSSNKYGCGLFVQCLPATKSSSKSKSKSSKTKCPSGSTKENCISACQGNGCCLKPLIPTKKKSKHNSKKKKNGN